MKPALPLAIAFALFGTAATAQDCSIGDADPWELTAEQVNEVYSCLEDALAAGYAAGDNAVAAEYREWAATATRPGLAGPHGERLLMTFANDIAAEQYLAYEIGNFSMPVGSVLAKESFKFADGGAVRNGPLFIMEKVAAGTADEFDNWVYSAVQPNGNPMGISQQFCHDCHAAFEDQDSMGYPLEEVRLTN